MTKKSFIAIILLFSFRAICFADTFIKAEVDKKSLTTDETLTYKLTVTSSEKKLPPAQLSKFEGFNIISQANSSTISFGQNQIKSILVYVYILQPSNSGKFSITPATIKINDKTYSSEAIEIEVKPGKAPPKITPQEKPSTPEQEIPESQEPQFTL